MTIGVTAESRLSASSHSWEVLGSLSEGLGVMVEGLDVGSADRVHAEFKFPGSVSVEIELTLRDAEMDVELGGWAGRLTKLRSTERHVALTRR